MPFVMYLTFAEFWSWLEISNSNFSLHSLFGENGRVLACCDHRSILPAPTSTPIVFLCFPRVSSSCLIHFNLMQQFLIQCLESLLRLLSFIFNLFLFFPAVGTSPLEGPLV